VLEADVVRHADVLAELPLGEAHERAVHRLRLDDLRRREHPDPPLSNAASGSQNPAVNGCPPTFVSAWTWWNSVVTASRSTDRNAADGVPSALSIAAVRKVALIGAGVRCLRSIGDDRRHDVYSVRADGNGHPAQVRANTGWAIWTRH